MRMRKKPNLGPRMDRCAALLVPNPEKLRGQWREAFPGYNRLWLELGCGKGRFTVQTALENPDVLFIALEKVADAMIIALERALEAGVSNVRFIVGDAVRLGDYFAPGEVSAVFVNFCDPWPRHRDERRRLTAPGFLALYEALLPPGGELRFKTDNDALFEYSLKMLIERGWRLSFHTRDLHENGPQSVMTDYEAKFHDQGVTINSCMAERPREETVCD